jgi:hypothetical protein
MAPADWNPRFVNGRRPRAFEFIQSQRRRYALITKWAEFMKDLDMFIGGVQADTGPNAQTGHPCAVLPYKFDGNLYNDDKILSVAHHFQAHTDFHARRPTI